MNEIGGYIELDTYDRPMLHEKAIALNCGRNALAYVLRSRGIKRLLVPRLICNSVINVCRRENVDVVLYSVGKDFFPAEEVRISDEEWLYIVNYYSQISNNQLEKLKEKHKRIIVDNAQSYFQAPIGGVDTLYTCRKYFGVSDGAFLYTTVKSDESYAVDESYQRMGFLLGRYEREASRFYAEYVHNNELMEFEPIKCMSKLTRNLLHGVNYESIQNVRESNYIILHRALDGVNELTLSTTPGTYMYPLLVKNGEQVRKKLQEKKIYIPILWPEVMERCAEDRIERSLAANVLPLPIDQRYGKNEMDYIIKEVLESIS